MEVEILLRSPETSGLRKRLQRTAWRSCNEEKAGTCPKKIPLEISKGIDVFYILGEIIQFLPRLCLLSPQHLYNPDTKTYCKENG